MIFVTVGTHEQQFDRLVEALDRLKGENKLTQRVFIQTGYSKYQPQHCDYADFIGYHQMLENIKKAEIVITHGGTGSVMLALYNHHIPIVVPRQHKYNEHVDDHQVIFCRFMESKKKIVGLYEMEDLEKCISDHGNLSETLKKETTNGTQPRLEERADQISLEISRICSSWFKKA